MDDLVTDGPRAGARGDRFPGLCVVLMAAVLTGCAGTPDPETPPVAVNEMSDFQTANGLLYPPELWSAVSISEAARLLRLSALDALGDVVSWPSSAEHSFQAVTLETTPLEAAYLIQDIGMISSHTDAPWSAEDITGWWETAAADGHADLMWMAAELAHAHGIALHLSDPARRVLVEALNGADALPAVLAADVLQELDPTTAPVVPSASATNVRSGRDAGQLLLRAAELGVSPDNADPLLLEMTKNAVPHDDWAYTYLVRAYVAAHMPADARHLADTFDDVRLINDGTVLEPPVFEGTLGSTFRMVRYLDATGGLESHLEAAEISHLSEAVRGSLDVDAVHRAAGMATLAILDPDAVPAVERRAAINAVLDAPTTGPMSIEQAFAWTYVAEYAHALGVAAPYSGLAPGVTAEWSAQVDQDAGAIARFLLALDRAGHLAEERDAAVMATTLASHLSADPAMLDSAVLFGGALAVHAATGRWVHDPQVLAAEADRRSGGCRGGFDGFWRMSRDDSTPCDVDVSWHVALGRGLWTDTGGEP